MRTQLGDLGVTVRRSGPPGTVRDGDADRDAVVVVANAAQVGEVLAAVADAREEAWRGLPVLLVVSPAAVAAADPDAVWSLIDGLAVRPVRTAELGLRLDLARRSAGAGSVRADARLRVDGLELDPVAYDARVEGRPLSLTHREYELLRYFVEHPGRVHTREDLLERVWGHDDYGRTRTVDVHVRRVRAKLGPGLAARIHTVRSVGYRFEG